MAKEIQYKGGAVERIFTERERKERAVLKALGEPNKIEAIVDQLQILLTAVATGDNTEVKKVASMVRRALAEPIRAIKQRPAKEQEEAHDEPDQNKRKKKKNKKRKHKE